MNLRQLQLKLEVAYRRVQKAKEKGLTYEEFIQQVEKVIGPNQYVDIADLNKVLDFTKNIKTSNHVSNNKKKHRKKTKNTLPQETMQAKDQLKTATPVPVATEETKPEGVVVKHNNDSLIALKKISALVNQGASDAPTEDDILTLKTAPHDEALWKTLREGITNHGTAGGNAQLFAQTMKTTGALDALFSSSQLSQNPSSSEMFYQSFINGLLTCGMFAEKRRDVTVAAPLATPAVAFKMK